MIPSKIKVAFEGVNRLYTYFNDQFDLNPEDVIYVEGKMWNRPGRIREVCRADEAESHIYNRVVQLVDLEVHGTYYSYGPYMFCFDKCAIGFDQFKSWVSPPEWNEGRKLEGGFEVRLDEIGYYDFISEKNLEYGMSCFDENRIEFLSAIDGRGYALVRDGGWNCVTFNCDQLAARNVICQNDPAVFCRHDVGVCLTLRTLLNLFKNEFRKQYDGSRFTAVSKSMFYKVIACNLKKITL